MKKKFIGITGKLTIGVVLFGLLLGGAASLLGYYEFTSVLEQQYNDAAYEIADTAATYLNPDKFEEYLATGQTDEEFDEIQRRLDELVEATNTTLIYVTTVDPADYRTLTYIYDSVNSSTGWDRYPLGYVQLGIAEPFVNDVRNIMTTGARAEEYLYYYSEESGAHTTAAIAIRNSSGDIVAMLGVEKAMTRLEAARSTYVKDVLIGTFVAVVLFMLVYTLFLHRQIISPILAVTNEAKRFADSNKPSDTLHAIKRKDEIGVLAHAISKMETDIEEYIINLTKVTAEKERIGAELNVATQIQADMLPSIFPAFPGRKEFDIYATMDPAKEVGGDFYDFFLVDDDHLVMVMADVSGKGVPAALFMVIAKTLIKNRTQMGGTPSEILTYVNNQLCEGNEAELFVTVWLAILEISTGKGISANAGHEHPVIRRANGNYELVEYRHSPAVATMEGIRFREREFELYPGDSLYVYTDGVPEATNANDELFGTDRMLEALNENPDASTSEVLEAVTRHIDAFVGEAPQFDDVTMLCLKYFGKGDQTDGSTQDTGKN